MSKGRKEYKSEARYCRKVYSYESRKENLCGQEGRNVYNRLTSTKKCDYHEAMS
jgi:hypothetical protein